MILWFVIRCHICFGAFTFPCPGCFCYEATLILMRDEKQAATLSDTLVCIYGLA